MICCSGVICISIKLARCNCRLKCSSKYFSIATYHCKCLHEICFSFCTKVSFRLDIQSANRKLFKRTYLFFRKWFYHVRNIERNFNLQCQILHAMRKRIGATKKFFTSGERDNSMKSLHMFYFADNFVLENIQCISVCQSITHSEFAH